jgi:ubiquinone/menaquinone biosynthesis C-methylase UbiE
VDAVSRSLNFDLLATPYKWLEYLSFGHALERCRFYFLPDLKDARRALILGDGDGRFLARLLAINPLLEADVVDISPAMLRLLEARLTQDQRERVTLHQADVRAFSPPEKPYDLVVTHFFLDCLFPTELVALVGRVTPRFATDARWVISEFSLPRSQPGAAMGKLLISGLYRVFGITTGLRVRALPDHASALKEVGLFPIDERRWLGGLLLSQLWQHNSAQSMQPSAYELPHTRE